MVVSDEGNFKRGKKEEGPVVINLQLQVVLSSRGIFRV
jgi:hypothetical protein